MEEVKKRCLNCGLELHIVRSGKKFCSAKCRQIAFNRRQSEGGSIIEWMGEEAQSKFAELTVIPVNYQSALQFPQIEVQMINGNRLLFYQTPSAEFIKHIIA